MILLIITEKRRLNGNHSLPSSSDDTNNNNSNNNTDNLSQLEQCHNDYHSVSKFKASMLHDIQSIIAAKLHRVKIDTHSIFLNA